MAGPRAIIAVPSRFAVLKIEDDDFRPVSNKSKEKKKVDGKQNGKKIDKPGVAPKKLGKPTQKKEKKKKASAEQWEQWKQKDNEYVDGNFEQDLHTAILQSKLDYEEKKTVYKLNKKEAEQEKKQENGKKKKNKAMSLEQFKNLVDDSGKAETEDVLPLADEVDDQFFERIQSDTKSELTKELHKDQTKEVKKSRKSFNNDTITIAQLQEKLEALTVENSSLRSELDKAKKEIIAVKTRNKSLCGILASGEMKDKADVLMDLDRLSRIRDELTGEVTRLHGLLEQERSKVGALTAEPHPHNKHKEKSRKKSNRD